MLTLASTSRISISIVATDEDGSLQHLLDIILLLAMELLNWVRLQLDIADDAKLLIIETRVLISRLTILFTNRDSSMGIRCHPLDRGHRADRDRDMGRILVQGRVELQNLGVSYRLFYSYSSSAWLTLG